MKNQFSIRFSFRRFSIVLHFIQFPFSDLVRSLFYFYCLVMSSHSYSRWYVSVCTLWLKWDGIRPKSTMPWHLKIILRERERMRERAIIKESGMKSNTYIFTVGVSYSRCSKPAHSKCNIRPWPHTPWMEIESINLSSKYLANKFNNFNCFHSWCRPHQCEADMDGKKVWAAEKMYRKRGKI